MKKIISLASIYGIIAVALTLVFTLIPMAKPASSWIAYAFAIVSLVGGLVIAWVAFRKAETLKSKFYGFPIMRLGVIYTCVQILVSIIFIIVGAFVKIPFWIALALSLVITALTAIGTIVGDNMRDTIESIETKSIDSTKQFRALQNKVADILDECKDDNIKVKLQELTDKFKYSDPVSSDSTKEKEDEIAEQLDELKTLVLGCEKEKTLELLDKISNLLSSRNRLCRTNK